MHNVFCLRVSISQLPKAWLHDVISGVTGHEKVKTHEITLNELKTVRLYENHDVFFKLTTATSFPGQKRSWERGWELKLRRLRRKQRTRWVNDGRTNQWWRNMF